MKRRRKTELRRKPMLKSDLDNSDELGNVGGMGILKLP